MQPQAFRRGSMIQWFDGCSKIRQRAVSNPDEENSTVSRLGRREVDSFRPRRGSSIFRLGRRESSGVGYGLRQREVDVSACMEAATLGRLQIGTEGAWRLQAAVSVLVRRGSIIQRTDGAWRLQART